jgi:glycosyltransferase involved in cell wall biosynthesis
MKVACVVHRYGVDFAGGSEAHCRHIAERLAVTHDVTVFTTCARDHITWRNEYPAGQTTLNGVRVRRYPVARQRSLHRFHDISEIAFSGRASLAEQEQWFRENGPDAPALVEALRQEGPAFDRVLFWAFRYAEVFFGVSAVADRAILVPTAEEDPLVRMEIVGPLFDRAKGFIFLTPEEQVLVERRLSGVPPPSVVIGAGLDPAIPASALPSAPGVHAPYLLYLGRIDPNKGCEALLHHFMRYASEHDDGLELVMAGPVNMPIPAHPRVRMLGFVAEETRAALLAHAATLVVPSRLESLSLVLLEAWNYGRPAIVNAHCRVLKGQARRANGALYYGNYDEFARAVEYLRERPDVASALGAQGQAYVEREYRWPTVMGKLEDLLQKVEVRR